VTAEESEDPMATTRSSSRTRKRRARRTRAPRATKRHWATLVGVFAVLVVLVLGIGMLTADRPAGSVLSGIGLVGLLLVIVVLPLASRRGKL
jgi:hypothetical protein